MAAWESAKGKLTGHRCSRCGSCMYLNDDGGFWCSSCDFRSHTMYDDINNYAFAPVPGDHPHIILFDPVIVDGRIE